MVAWTEVSGQRNGRKNEHDVFIFDDKYKRPGRETKCGGDVLKVKRVSLTLILMFWAIQ